MILCPCDPDKPPHPYLVSAIMPTRGRRHLVYRAVNSFISQTHPHRELVILDDEADPSFAELPHELDLFFHNIRYLRLSETLNIPQKRNLACEAARGCVITHWDSDDWSASDRMKSQAEFLELSSKKVVGFNSMLFYRLEDAKAFRYISGQTRYAVGGSLTYFRSWWKKNPFDERQRAGEDNEFVWAAMRAHEIKCAPGGPLAVALIHAGNTCAKDLDGDSFVPVETREIPPGFFECKPDCLDM